MKKIISLCLAFILIGGFTMARGTPDGGESLSSSPVAQVFDPGENTTRLLMGGGSNSRSGRWLWATGFESGLGEITSLITSAGGVVPKISKEGCYQGAQCLLSEQPAIVNAQLQIVKYLYSPYNPSSKNVKIAQEVMVGFETTDAHRISISIQAKDPGDKNQTLEYVLRFDVGPGNVANIYTVANGVPSFIASINGFVINNSTIFHYLKLTVDLKTKTFDKVILNENIFDISSRPCTIILSKNPGITANILHINLSNAAIARARFDNWIVTADEP